MEEENLINDDKSLNTREMENSLSYQEITDIVDNFGADYASFSSDKSYYRFISSFYDLSEMEREQILGKLKFETIDAFLHGLLEQIDKMQTREEVFNFIDTNSKYLKLERSSDGEEYVEFNNYSEHISNSFFNKDQIIKVGDVYYKYVDDVCVLGEDLNKIRELDTKEKILNSNLDYFIATNMINEYESIVVRWGDLEKLYTWEKAFNPGWCKNDRKVKMKLIFRGSGFPLYVDNKLISASVVVSRSSIVKAFRKGIPCIWYRHKDNITWKNFSFEYDLKIGEDITHYFWSKPDMTFENTYYQDFTEKIFEFDKLKTDFDCQWTKKGSSVTTSEMNGVWLHVAE